MRSLLIIDAVTYLPAKQAKKSSRERECRQGHYVCRYDILYMEIGNSEDQKTEWMIEHSILDGFFLITIQF